MKIKKQILLLCYLFILSAEFGCKSSADLGKVPLPVHYIFLFDSLETNLPAKFRQLLFNQMSLDDPPHERYSDVFFKVYTTGDFQHPIDLILRAETLAISDREKEINKFLDEIQNRISRPNDEQHVLESMSEIFSNAIGDTSENHIVIICSHLIENSGGFVPTHIVPANPGQTGGSNEKHNFRFLVDAAVNIADLKVARDELGSQDSWITQNIVAAINAKPSDKIRIFWENVDMGKDAIHSFWETFFEKIKLKNIKRVDNIDDWGNLIRQDLK